MRACCLRSEPPQRVRERSFASWQVTNAVHVRSSEVSKLQWPASLSRMHLCFPAMLAAKRVSFERLLACPPLTAGGRVADSALHLKVRGDRALNEISVS
jgi:hypothetical protein